jgi:hypothetical protein
MPASQNSSNCAFRCGFLHFATIPTAKSGFKYTWPFDKYCIIKVQENARTLGVRLYDDRKGTMYSDFNIRDNESNVFIVDKKGVVSYRKAGRLNDAEIDDVMKLLQKLATL